MSSPTNDPTNDLQPTYEPLDACATAWRFLHEALAWLQRLGVKPAQIVVDEQNSLDWICIPVSVPLRDPPASWPKTAWEGILKNAPVCTLLTVREEAYFEERITERLREFARSRGFSDGTRLINVLNKALQEADCWYEYEKKSAL